MYIKLFEIKDKVAIPTEHCYVLEFLKRIIDLYPDQYTKIFAYLQYMCSWNPDDNPFLAIKDEDKEEAVLKYIGAEFSTEDEPIFEALENCKKLYELPAYRAFQTLKIALDNVRAYLANNKVISGKDGNNKDYRDTMKDLPHLEKAYNEGYKSFMEEARLQVRGNKFNTQV